MQLMVTIGTTLASHPIVEKRQKTKNKKREKRKHMSHLITKFDTVYTPNGEFAETWHGLQTCLEMPIALDGGNTPNVFVPIVESKFTLSDVDATRLVSDALNDDDETKADTDNPLNNWKMILADHPKGLLPLHVPKAGYVIHQNKALFDSFVQAADKVLGKGEMEIATLGTLGACSQFFVSISIKSMDKFKVGKGKHADIQRMFFNLVSSHNGIVSSAIMLSIVRMVCMNTVMASLSDAESNGRQTKFKHTANSLALITPESFEASLKQWLSAAESYQTALNAFTGVTMTLDGFRAFASGVFTNDGSDSLSTTSFNRVAEMEVLFQRGKGNKGETLYDGVNAFTEYFTSGNGVGKGKGTKAANRVARANFGRGNDWKKLAIAIATDEEDYKATMERGERFYGDKLKANTAPQAD
jgi:hypothetical protein